MHKTAASKPSAKGPLYVIGDKVTKPRPWNRVRGALYKVQQHGGAMMRRHGKHLDILITLLRRTSHLLRRHPRQLSLFVLVFLLFDITLTLHASQPAIQNPIPTSVNKEKIYIASLHWNGAQLIHQYWAPAVLDLVRHFGKDNVYVSVLAGGSLDHAEGPLRELDWELEKLGVERNIEIREQTHADEVNRVPEEGETGWIETRRGKKELRRIPYLAGLRNRAMEKLQELAERKDNKRRFDKILWLNDVIFNVWRPCHLSGLC
jgi:hypothetical protein